MGIYEQIVLRGLETGDLRIVLSDQGQDWVEGKCCQTLNEIRAVLNDDSLDDRECFMKIERIVEIYEQIGSDGGIRHDFG